MPDPHGLLPFAPAWLESGLGRQLGDYVAAFLDDPGLVIMSIGALVGVAASLLGTFLVLRRSSMLADAISHSILLGIVMVFLLTGSVNSPFQIVGAALAGVLTVFLIERLAKSGLVKDDAAIGLVFPALFAVAVLLINVFARNVHLDVHAVLLGEIAFAWLDTVTLGPFEVPRSLLTMSLIALVNLAFVGLLYKELKLATFDEALAKALGFRPVALYYALLTLTSVTAVGAFDAVGAILLIAFVIVPPSAAYLLTDRLWGMLLYGALISVLSSVSGYYLARVFDVSIGGMMASMTGLFFVLAFLFGPRYGLISQELRRRRQAQDNAERTLLVHLYSHENGHENGRAAEHAAGRGPGAGPGQENTRPALESHLRWDAARAERTLRRSVRRGLVRQRGDRLELTEAGRALAREVLEPFAR